MTGDARRVTGATPLMERGLAAWREARYADALDDARAWIAAEPRSTQAHQLAGQAAARLGDATAAAGGSAAVRHPSVRIRMNPQGPWPTAEKHSNL